jgi:hypothetical protein
VGGECVDFGFAHSRGTGFFQFAEDVCSRKHLPFFSGNGEAIEGVEYIFLRIVPAKRGVVFLDTPLLFFGEPMEVAGLQLSALSCLFSTRATVEACGR